ncbi:hypothetical protein [Coleofasciculus sp.]|uniref:hypothetical protein n=1 Tax=Coleofasciculus sp. TaxID=3100458 RepID=UPI003A1C15AF
MVQTPASRETETLSIELPKAIGLYVTQEQFAALAAANRDLRLERSAKGELILTSSPPYKDGDSFPVSQSKKDCLDS